MPAPPLMVMRAATRQSPAMRPALSFNAPSSCAQKNHYLPTPRTPHHSTCDAPSIIPWTSKPCPEEPSKNHYLPTPESMSLLPKLSKERTPHCRSEPLLGEREETLRDHGRQLWDKGSVKRDAGRMGTLACGLTAFHAFSRASITASKIVISPALRRLAAAAWPPDAKPVFAILQWRRCR